MKDLNDLLRALVTVIVRYEAIKENTHQNIKSVLCGIDENPDEPSDSNLNTNPDSLPEQISADWMVQKITICQISEVEFIDALLQEPDMSTSLMVLINQAAQVSDKRRILLLYILENVTLLQQNIPSSDIPVFLDQKIDGGYIQETVSNLLCNLHALSNTAQALLINDKSIPGLKSLVSSDLQQLIEKCVFMPLKITQNTEKPTLELHAKCLCLASQSIFTQQLKEQFISALKENTILKKEHPEFKGGSHAPVQQLMKHKPTITPISTSRNSFLNQMVTKISGAVEQGIEALCADSVEDEKSNAIIGYNHWDF